MYIIVLLISLFNLDNKIYFTKDNIDKYDPALVLAGIAEHECYDLSLIERHLVMEAMWNRVIDNYNNNGYTLKDQLLAPKQHTGLFKYNPKQFCFDLNNDRHLQNYQMAVNIINNHERLTNRCIYYWAGDCDKNTSHYRFVLSNKLEGFNTRQIFR